MRESLKLPRVRPGRTTAVHDREIVVFVLGARIVKPWRPDAWIPTHYGFLKMVRWLNRHPQDGLLGNHFALIHGGFAGVQYWDSYEALERFARNDGAPHVPVWSWYRKLVEQPGTCGIWHETYVLSPGSWECVYTNMPVVGLPAATTAVAPGPRGASSRGRRRQNVA